jgi:hypothetical protein
MKKYDITSMPYPFWILDHLILPRLRSSLISRYGIQNVLYRLMDEMIWLRFREDKR